MGMKSLLLLSVILVGMSFFAIAADTCRYEGKEFENRDVTMIDGKCMMCFNGEWTEMPYKVSEMRCHGKL